MPFTAKSGKFNASIKTVTIGTGDKAITLGGENALPLQSFDAPFTNAPIRVDQLSDGSRTAEFIYVYTQLGNTDEIIDITSCGPNALKYIFEKYKECSLNVLLTHLEIPKDIIFDFEYNGYLLHNTSEIFE